jgi:hypothetical protein
VSLRDILPLCPVGVRVAAWAKSFCAFKRGVRPCYAWEPVMFWRGRNPPAGHPHQPPERAGKQTTPKDFIVEPITMRKGLTGAKPRKVCAWILDLLGALPGDDVVDLFPGTGAMGDAFDHLAGSPRSQLHQLNLPAVNAGGSEQGPPIGEKCAPNSNS